MLLWIAKREGYTTLSSTFLSESSLLDYQVNPLVLYDKLLWLFYQGSDYVPARQSPLTDSFYQTGGYAGLPPSNSQALPANNQLEQSMSQASPYDHCQNHRREWAMNETHPLEGGIQLHSYFLV